MNPIKILVLTTTFLRWHDDSMPAFVYELSKRLQEKGFEIVVLAPHHQGARKFEMMNGMKIYRFPYFYPLKYQRLCYGGGMLYNIKKSNLAKVQLPLFILVCIYYTLRIIKKEKIDFVHAHWIFPSGLVGGIVKRILRRPLIVTVHGSDVALKKYPLFKHIGKQIFKLVDRCTVNSTATKDSLFLLSPDKEPEIIPMGVDLNLFRPHTGQIDRENPDKKPVILTVSRLNKKKGIHYLIDAMPEIINKFPEAKLVIAGDGPEKDNLMNQIKRLHLEENVSLVGAVQNKHLPGFYDKADLFVLPTLNEGLGVVLLEAMACGTPVMGSNVGGVPDIIIDGENGLFIKPGNSGDIAEKIISCLSDRTLLRKFSVNGQNTVAEKFSWDSIVERFSNVYGVLPHG